MTQPGRERYRAPLTRLRCGDSSPPRPRAPLTTRPARLFSPLLVTRMLPARITSHLLPSASTDGCAGDLAKPRRAGKLPGLVQVVALDECDPVTFNAPPPGGQVLTFAGTSRLDSVPRYPTYSHWRRLEPLIRAGTLNPTSWRSRREPSFRWSTKEVSLTLLRR